MCIENHDYISFGSQDTACDEWTERPTDENKDTQRYKVTYRLTLQRPTTYKYITEPVKEGS